MLTRRSALSAAAAAALFPAIVVPRRARADAPITIRVATTPDDASMAVVFADRTGPCRAAGITVDIQQQSSGAAIAAGIVGGAYDVGKSSLTSVLNAHLKNTP
jgi:ABC-type nitrate/sulfonate/bicarbonate transport system substrate-binding protein